MTQTTTPAEQQRLSDDAARKANWKRWGPYLSDRQWATVREDYSADGDCWNYLSHDQSRSRAYRWGEDGLLGITDRECRLCFALALWNGRDPILKERLFGLTNTEGNHGEDVKEQYFYIDSTPTHSYMKGLYKYPQAAFPYGQLLSENRNRTRAQTEFEILDTGVFDESRYFDVFVEYAKADQDDILIRITVANRGPDSAQIHILPTLWFRNTWTWGCKQEGCWPKPNIGKASGNSLTTEHTTLAPMRFDYEGSVPVLFTDNHTNADRLFGSESPPWVKDAFGKYLIEGKTDAVNPKGFGTKAAPLYALTIDAGKEAIIRLRLRPASSTTDAFAGFDDAFKQRKAEADEFYASKISANLSPDQRQVARQAYAGLLWSKQFYEYVVQDWLNGDPNFPPPPESRLKGRNSDWPHMYCRDVISMPDKWEYPWFAAWDLAFHMLPMAKLDGKFAKDQLILFLREWYMHPSGQLPAYEFNFSDVNPPVHAWACWRVYKMTGPKGKRDRQFLAKCFQKLMINFTWWVNRKDISGKHIFSGGFLGLDNIGVFDRSRPLPTGGSLEQADGTAWMAFFCNTMLAMALELASEDPVYEDVASKFFEHFVAIADAINTLGGTGLWDEQDGFYYDQLTKQQGGTIPLRVRSLVGAIPLLAAEVFPEGIIDKLPGFAKRLKWFVENRKDLARRISYMEHGGGKGLMLLAIPSRERLERVLKYLLDESEFLSPFGIRSLSKVHKDKPYVFHAESATYSVGYSPGECESALFGGNSNWRGPVWFPINYLLIEALERYHHFYGDDFTVEFPTGSGKRITLGAAATELARRMSSLFLRNESGQRPSMPEARFTDDPNWRDLLLFHEYFHADNGRGLGASHQTGWTSLVTRCLDTLATRNGK